MQLVVFKLGPEEYAIPIEQVREIINYVTVTRLPETPPYFEGIINVRGKIIPVVDFAAKLGVLRERSMKQIVIVEVKNKEIGLTVDMVTEVIQVDPESGSTIESVDGQNQTSQRVCKYRDRIIILIDINTML